METVCFTKALGFYQTTSVHFSEALLIFLQLTQSYYNTKGSVEDFDSLSSVLPTSQDG